MRVDRSFSILLLCGAAACGAADSQIIGTWRNGDDQVLSVSGSGEDGIFMGQLTQAGDCGPAVSVEINRDPFDQYSILIQGPTPMLIPEGQGGSLSTPVYCVTDELSSLCTFCAVTDDTIEECDTSERDVDTLAVTVTHHCGWRRISAEAEPELSPTGAGCPPALDSFCSGGLAGLPNGM